MTTADLFIIGQACGATIGQTVAQIGPRVELWFPSNDKLCEKKVDGCQAALKEIKGIGTYRHRYQTVAVLGINIFTSFFK